MACARELDYILANDDTVKTYIKYFLEGRLEAFR